MRIFGFCEARSPMAHPHLCHPHELFLEAHSEELQSYELPGDESIANTDATLFLEHMLTLARDVEKFHDQQMSVGGDRSTRAAKPAT